jgi:hypothetical protein
LGVGGLSTNDKQVGMGFQSYAGVDAAMWQRKSDNTAWGNTNYLIEIAELERQWKTVE